MTLLRENRSLLFSLYVCRRYNGCMESATKYTVFVMQSGINPKDVYVAETTKDPAEVIARYNSISDPKTLPKPLGKMLPLTLRMDLAGTDNVFTSQSEATEYRKLLSADIEKQSIRYSLQSKRSYFFGRKKSVKNKQTGKYELNLDPSLLKGSDSRAGMARLDEKSAFASARKKSDEWNDEAARKLDMDLRVKSTQRNHDK